jgi:hypothetical protein
MELASKTPSFFKNWRMGKIPPPKKNVPVNFICVLSPLWALLTPEDGTDRLSQNVGKELLICAV